MILKQLKQFCKFQSFLIKPQFSTLKRTLPNFMTLVLIIIGFLLINYKQSDLAAQRIRELMEKKNDPQIIGVKIGIKQRGCSGLTYTMNYVKENEKQKFDEIIQEKDIKIIIDQKALMALVGTQMDYVDDDLKSEFVFKNPNSKGTCGCGESFYI